MSGAPFNFNFRPWATREEFIRWAEANCGWCYWSDPDEPGSMCSADYMLHQFAARKELGVQVSETERVPYLTELAAGILGVGENELIGYRTCRGYSGEKGSD